MMQLIVLGMHRSGTSVLARLLNMMGAYFGPEGVNTGANKENPKGFWERRDVRQLNDFVLQSVGCDWDRVADFKIRTLPDAVVNEFRTRASNIVLEMDAHRPWLLKEPRLCLLLELWKEHFEVPVCLHIYRHPLEVAQSLLARNGIPTHTGIALWEKYNNTALKASRGLPRLTVSHNNLMNMPEVEVKNIYEQLLGFDVDSLRMPSKREITSFVRNDLYRERVNEDKLAQHLNGRQMQMFKALCNGEISTNKKDYELSEAAKTILKEYENNQRSVQNEKCVHEEDNKHNAEPRSQLEKREKELSQQIEPQKQEARIAQSDAEKLLVELRNKHDQKEKTLTKRINQQAKRAKDKQDVSSKLLAESHVLNAQLEEKLLVLSKANAEIKHELSVIKSQSFETEKELAASRNILSNNREKIENLEARVASETKAANDGLKLADNRLQDIKKLVHWLHVIEFHLGSWRWRAGRVAVGTLAKMLGKREGEIDADDINKVLASFKSWERTTDSLSADELAVIANREIDKKSADRHALLIQSSGMFDRNWYLKEYPDVKDNGIDPIFHYVKFGSKENRNPSPDFNTKWYVQNYPDVARSGINPLEHYILHGRDEFRSTMPFLRSVPLEDVSEKIEIVVTVFNALSDVKKCLNSIKAKRDGFVVDVIVVNDGSNRQTTAWLNEFCGNNENFHLIEHASNKGYTKAVNSGLKVSTAPYVVVLNSDTIVTRGWLKGILGCFHSDQKIGIVGPLSSAASWQNVPDLCDASGNFAINNLPIGMTPDDVAQAVAAASSRIYPKLPFVNGFCFVIRRKVIDAIGLMDEENFPVGYGEENDYCIRAGDAGFCLAIADDAYVFHAKSKSFGHERRKELSKQGSDALIRKHTPSKFNALIEQVKNTELLDKVRASVQEVLATNAQNLKKVDNGSLKVLFLLPAQGGGGGTHSIVQEVSEMQRLGFSANIAVKESDRYELLATYQDIERIQDLFVDIATENLVLNCKDYDVVVGTIFHSMPLVKKIVDAYPHILPAYYIQDYEPLFFQPESENWKAARESYDLIPNMLLFAKTFWIANMVEQNHGVLVQKVSPSIDHNVYKPGQKQKGDGVRIAAMIRPQTPWRGAERTMRLLSRLAKESTKKLTFCLFGCPEGDQGFQRLQLDFDYQNHGVLTRPEVASLLAKCDVFIDLSDHQAFGRTALEAMACGCTAMVPAYGGTDEYAIDDVNALIVDSFNEEECFKRLDGLIRDDEKLKNMQKEGSRTAAKYSVSQAATSELELFKQFLPEHRMQLPFQQVSNDTSIVSQNIEIAKLFEAKQTKFHKPPKNVHIIVYASGACESLRRSLRSLHRNTQLEDNFLYVIDDSQNPAVSEKIQSWLEGIPFAKLISPADHSGYYVAVRALIAKLGESDFCILRETVIVTENWLESLKEAAYSSAKIGLVSPVTQFHPYYQFSLKPGDNIFTCSEKLSLVSRHEYPGLPIPDPNIFYLKKAVLRKVTFPGHAGDTTEKSLIRFVVELLKNNLVCALADDSFAHVSSKFNPYPDLDAKRIMEQVYPKDKPLFRDVVNYVKNQRFESLFCYENSDIRLVKNRTLGVLFSSIILRGGVIVLVDLVNDLILEGIDAKAFLLNPRQRESDRFDLLFEPVNTPQPKDVAGYLPRNSNLMATFWATVPFAEKLIEGDPTLNGYYFMQDFEVMFYDPDDSTQKDYHKGASDSYYTALKKITTSDWILNKVRGFVEDASMPIHKINVGVNLEFFYPDKIVRETEQRVRVLAMARPETPRRGFDELIKAFTLLSKQRKNLEFVLFGSDQLTSLDIPFNFQNLGIINPELLRLEYTRADIFVDASRFQGFGLAPLEAMACGCACVLTDSGGIREYAKDDVNAVFVPTGDVKKIATAIATLADDATKRSKLIEAGFDTVRRFSNHNLAVGVQELIDARSEDLSTSARMKSQENRCNIIIPVYNEISVVSRCLESVAKYTEYPHQAIIVDDGSDNHCAQYLMEFAESHKNFQYIRNKKNIGFVGSVNRGMAESEAGDIVLLNSDTIVTQDWLGRISRCANSDEKIGIVSPLSTHSSHLWLQMNPGDSIFDTARQVAKVSSCKYPDIVTPEGWCFYIKREVYELLGGFDTIFGRGYCEESDYCMQAYANGYRMVCCDNAFVYHEGMVTFKDEKGDRYKNNRQIFDNRWKPLYQKIYEDFLSNDPLQEIRIRYERTRKRGYLTPEDASHKRYPEAIEILNDGKAMKEVSEFEKSGKRQIDSGSEEFSITFVISTFRPFGGVISVVQLVNDLLLSGTDAKVVVLSPKDYQGSAGLLTRPIMFEDNESLLKHFPKTTVVVGTLWITMYYIARLALRRPDILPAYFVQDFEPFFYPEEDKSLRQAVARTYQWTDLCFAKTPWIAEQVRSVGGEISLVPPALDLQLFYPKDVDVDPGKKIVLTMLRPSTPQRGFEVAVRVLTRLMKERDDIVIHTFGTSDEELKEQVIPFEYINHGVVPNARLPIIYSKADIFAEFSHFHGFGRTIAEAMACGTACVITASGGVSAFAVHEENCLVAPAGDIAALKVGLTRLLDDKLVRTQFGIKGRKAVKCFGRKESALATFELLAKQK
jgi:GT2 family glycosyltransferase/glycosyltransferase involved in cell wall biosynthesis